MSIDRKAYRAAKKAYKSKVKSNKKIVRSNNKIDRKNTRATNAHEKTVKRENKEYEKAVFHKLTPSPPAMMVKQRQYPTGPKPEKIFYKGSKPQKATGSSAANARMQNVINKLNK